MKIFESTITAESVGGPQLRRLTFNSDEDSAVAARIFATGLYSDPMAIAIQEAVANGIDAMEEAGIENPCVEIATPTMLGSRNLIIKDRGVGMTKEHAERYFLGVNGSSKRGNNVKRGGFGIGCQAPFAIDGVISWTVITIKDGLRTILTMALDETGLPAGAAHDSDPVDEPNGTTIIIPIPEDRVSQVRDKCLDRFWTWRPGMVSIDGEIPPTIYDDEDQHRVGDLGWISKSANTYYGRNGVDLTVITGDSRYTATLDSNEVSDVCGEFAYLVSGYSAYDIHLFADLGTVTIAPNRTNLVVDNKTKRTLKELFQAFGRQLVAEIQSKLDNATSEGEALQAVYGASRYIRSAQLMWNGDNVPESVQVPGYVYYYDQKKRTKDRANSPVHVGVSYKTDRDYQNGRHSRRFYVIDASMVDVESSVVMSHFTTYVKTDSFDAPDYFGVYKLPSESLENAWVKGAIDNGTLAVIKADEIIEKSKAYRRANRAASTNTGTRAAVTYPVAQMVEGRMVIEHLSLSDLRSKVDGWTGELLLMCESELDDSERKLSYAEFFTEDQLVIINRANRQVDTLMKRLHRETRPKNTGAHIAEILQERSDALIAEEGEIDQDALRAALLNRSGSLRSFLASLKNYCEEESVEVTNTEIKELMRVAADLQGFNNKHAKIWELATKTGADHYVPEIRVRADTSYEDVESYRKKLKKEHPLVMAALQSMFNWKRSVLADMVLLINLKS